MPHHPKLARAEHDVLELIQRRWSPRSFDAAREVSRADLLRLFEAARWAPSSMNEQPWRFIVATRSGTPEAFAALFDTLDEGNRVWAAAAPVLVLVAAHPRIERWGIENPHAFYDTGQAMAFLTLQATELRLAVRQMEGFDAARARVATGVPGEFALIVVAAIGYAGQPEALAHERHRTAEQKPRERRILEETVFGGTWGRAL